MKILRDGKWLEIPGKATKEALRYAAGLRGLPDARGDLRRTPLPRRRPASPFWKCLTPWPL